MGERPPDGAPQPPFETCGFSHEYVFQADFMVAASAEDYTDADGRGLWVPRGWGGMCYRDDADAVWESWEAWFRERVPEGEMLTADEVARRLNGEPE